MIAELGGPYDFVERPEKHLPKPKVVFEYPAKSSGFLAGMNGRILGEAVIELGGGRKRANDSLDHSVGLDRIARLGTEILCEIRFCVSVRLMMPRPGGFHLFWMMPSFFPKIRANPRLSYYKPYHPSNEQAPNDYRSPLGSAQVEPDATQGNSRANFPSTALGNFHAFGL